MELWAEAEPTKNQIQIINKGNLQLLSCKWDFSCKNSMQHVTVDLYEAEFFEAQAFVKRCYRGSISKVSDLFSITLYRATQEQH